MPQRVRRLCSLRGRCETRGPTIGLHGDWRCARLSRLPLRRQCFALNRTRAATATPTGPGAAQATFGKKEHRTPKENMRGAVRLAARLAFCCCKHVSRRLANEQHRAASRFGSTRCTRCYPTGCACRIHTRHQTRDAHAGFLQRKQADQSNQRRDLCHNRCACPVPVGQCTAGREHQLFFHETARRATLVVSPPHA